MYVIETSNIFLESLVSFILLCVGEKMGFDAIILDGLLVANQIVNEGRIKKKR